MVHVTKSICDKVIAQQNQILSLYICVVFRFGKRHYFSNSKPVKWIRILYIHIICIVHVYLLYSLYLYVYLYTDTGMYRHLFSVFIHFFTSQTSGYGEFYFPGCISVHRPTPTSSSFLFYMIDTFRSSRKMTRFLKA